MIGRKVLWFKKKLSNLRCICLAPSPTSLPNRKALPFCPNWNEEGKLFRLLLGILCDSYGLRGIEKGGKKREEKEAFPHLQRERKQKGDGEKGRKRKKGCEERIETF